MDWPANSPDLNPIENLWNIVKRNVERKNAAKSERSTDFMKEEWDATPESILINLIKLMRHRCELVIENNGERTPY